MSCEINEWTSLCFARILHNDIRRFIKSVEAICRSDGVIMEERFGMSHDGVIMENRACERSARLHDTVPASHDIVTLYNSQGEHCQVYFHRDGDKGIRILVNSARPLRHFREEYSVKTLDSFILHLRNFHGISYFTKGPSIVWSGAKYLLTKRLNPERQGRMDVLPSETEPVIDLLRMTVLQIPSRL